MMRLSCPTAACRECMRGDVSSRALDRCTPGKVSPRAGRSSKAYSLKLHLASNSRILFMKERGRQLGAGAVRWRLYFTYTHRNTAPGLATSDGCPVAEIWYRSSAKVLEESERAHISYQQ